VRAASPDLLRAVRGELASGRFLDSRYSTRGDRVAVLGPDAARRLGIGGVEWLPAIYVGDHLYLVIGILRDVVRKPELLGSVIIPEGHGATGFWPLWARSRGRGDEDRRCLPDRASGAAGAAAR
jgi:hypothetical protein